MAPSAGLGCPTTGKIVHFLLFSALILKGRYFTIATYGSSKNARLLCDRRTDEVTGDSCHARTATRRATLGTGRRRHRDQVAWRADGRHRSAADGPRRSAQVRFAGP